MESASRSQSPEQKVPDGVLAVSVTRVRHYTDRLFMFRTTRPRELRFRSGEFVMLSLQSMDRPVYRAYSIASPAWDEELEFFSIKVPGGPLTEKLQKIREGDGILIRRKPSGTLVVDALLPGKRVFMFSTGTGIAPFASLIRDPETYDRFGQVILTQTCREERELAYARELVAKTLDDPLVGEIAAGKLLTCLTTTREPGPVTGRITMLVESGKLFDHLGIPPLDPETDRGMICGSVNMLSDCREIFRRRNFVAGSNSDPGTYVIERAFVS